VLNAEGDGSDIFHTANTKRFCNLQKNQHSLGAVLHKNSLLVLSNFVYVGQQFDDSSFCKCCFPNVVNVLSFFLNLLLDNHFGAFLSFT